MRTSKRTGALLLCLGLVLVLSVSAAFIAHEADHDCSGENCPVCLAIASNIRLLRMIGLAALVLLSLFFLLNGTSVRNRRNRYTHFCLRTPVTWKVRLND